MDFTFQPTQRSARLTSNGVSNTNVNSIYGIPDDNISEDLDLFRGLNSIGSHFDAFNPFSAQDQFLTPHTENRHFQQHQNPLGQHPPHGTQPLQAPKSLSPDVGPGDAQHPHFEINGGSQSQPNNNVPSIELGDVPSEPTRSSSEEKDGNSQDRRKAQNRAAQRAFRERKEKHVKDLEAKLRSLSEKTAGLQSENERLNRELAAVGTQNEILRATAVRPPSAASGHNAMPPFRRPPSPTLGPQTFTPTDFIIATGSEASTPLQFDAYPNDRGRMLLAGAAWDLIQRDKRVQSGQVDLTEVCSKLNGRAVCDGRGPAFREDEVKRILDECSLGGVNDDLL